MENPKVINKRSMEEENGSRLAMSSLAKRQRKGQRSAKNTTAIAIKRLTDPFVTQTFPGDLVSPTQEPEVVDLSFEVTAKPICRPPNEFPCFSNGDVFIDLGSLGLVRYQIHSAVLRRASTWFDETLDYPIAEVDDIVAANHTKRTGIRARYELSFNSDLRVFVLERATLTKVKKPVEKLSTQHAALIDTGSRHPSNATETRLANVEQSSSDSNANVLSSIQRRSLHSSSATPIPRPIQTSTSQSPSPMSHMIETQGKEVDPLNLPILPKVKAGEPLIKQEDSFPTSTLTGTRNPILSCESHIPLTESQAATNQVQNAAEENRVANMLKQAVTQELPVSTKERQVTTGTNQEVIPMEKKVINQVDQATPPKDEVLAAYKCFFRIFYGKPTSIDTNNINEALRQVEAVIRVAELYGSIPFVRAHLSNCLLQYGRDLYAAILKDPPRWLQLSLYLESAPIFKEAAVHIIGNLGHWPWATVQLKDFPEDFRGADGLFQRKVDELKILMADAEKNLFLISTHVEGEESLLAQMYKKTIITWYMVRLWKRWFSRAITNDEVPKGTKRRDGTKYRLIAKGGDAYLPLKLVINQIRVFREPIWLTEADKQGIEEDLKMIKAFAQKQVDRLCTNTSMISAEEAGIEHLTCISVDNDDIPWLKEEVSLVPDAAEALEQ